MPVCPFHRHVWYRRLNGLWSLLLLAALLGCVPAFADPNTPSKGYHDSEALTFFPGADRIGPVSGTPPSASVYKGDRTVGYLFETKRVAPIPAYSGQPVNVLVGIDTQGVITGTKVLEQHEPILLVGIPVQKLYDFCGQYVGKKVTDTIEVGQADKPGAISVDAISSATVTVMVVNRTIMHAALEVAVTRKIVSAAAAKLHSIAKVKMDDFQKADWKTLTGGGSIRRLRLDVGQVDDAFANTEAAHSDERGDVGRDPKSTFIDLYYAYLNAPTIGRNLLGKSQYDWLMSTLKPGEHAVAVLGNGYSFKDSGYVRGGIFDRVHLVQNGQNILFHDLDYYRLNDTALAGMPRFTEMAIFIVSATLLGWVFIAIAFLISVSVGEKARAAGLALVVWFWFVLVFDLLLLGMLVLGAQHLSGGLLRLLLLLNPTDVFRLANLAGFESTRAYSGLAAIATGPLFTPWALVAVLLGWVAAPLGAALLIFQRRRL